MNKRKEKKSEWSTFINQKKLKRLLDKTDF